MTLEYRNSSGITIHETDSPELVEVATKVQELRTAATQASNAHGRHIDAINRDEGLSDQGKKDRIADLEANRKVARLDAINREKKVITDKITALERRLDGYVGYSSDNIMAFRDAQDRAEAIDDADRAATVMARALRTGDKTLAHALYRRAVDNRWKEARGAFAQENPTVAGLVNDVHMLQKLHDDGFNRTVAYM
ncbi:hypothetical protein [Microbacterium sp. NPDC089696]|uniref:hypothetical protein n=1 Tax=Microbacterium sp. NPDC089696 TaxID=3364199 RepID=UPI0038109D19